MSEPSSRRGHRVVSVAAAQEIIAAANRHQRDGHPQIKPPEAGHLHFRPQPLEHFVAPGRLDKPVANGQTGDHRRREVVQLAVLAPPPGQPAGGRIRKRFRVGRFEPPGPLGVPGLLLAVRATALPDRPGSGRRGRQRVAVGVFVAGIDRVIGRVGPHRFLERAIIPTMGRLDEPIVIHVATDHVVGDPFKPVDALGKPIAIAGGFHVVPGSDQNSGWLVENDGNPSSRSLRRWGPCGGRATIQSSGAPGPSWRIPGAISGVHRAWSA